MPSRRARRLAAALAACGFACLGFGVASALADAPVSAAIADDFNRADGLSGSPWVAMNAASMQTPRVISNQAGETTGTTNAYLGGTSYSDVQAQLKVMTPPGNQIVLNLRTDGTVGYGVGWVQGSWNIYKITVGNTYTGIGSGATGTLSAGDCIAATAVGAVLTGWYQSGCSGPWVAEVSRTDATYSSGYVGIRYLDVTGRFDDLRVAAYSDPQTVTSTTTLYTAPATQTVTTTVVSGGGGTSTVAVGSNCGGTTTDAGGATVDQPACSVVLDAGDSTKLDYSWIGSALLFGVFLIAPITRYFNREQSGWGGGA
jgi:hypothetical protein